MGHKTRLLLVARPVGRFIWSRAWAAAIVLGAGMRPLVLPDALTRRAAVLIGPLLIWLAMLGPVISAELDDAVMVQGSGTLTTCRSWFFFNSCTTHKVHLPERVAAGDKVTLTYGSNPKNYSFHVALIRLEGDACTLLSENSRYDGEGEKIEVARCGPFPEPISKTR
jgi:hypothetical protein